MTSWSTPLTSDQEDKGAVDNDEHVESRSSSPRSTLTPTSDSGDEAWEKVFTEESDTTLDVSKLRAQDGDEEDDVEVEVEEPMKVLSPRPEVDHSGIPSLDGDRLPKDDVPEEKLSKDDVDENGENTHVSHELRKSESAHRHHSHYHPHHHSHHRPHHRAFGLKQSHCFSKKPNSVPKRGRQFEWNTHHGLAASYREHHDYKPHRSWGTFETWRNENHMPRPGPSKTHSGHHRRVSFMDSVRNSPGMFQSNSAPVNASWSNPRNKYESSEESQYGSSDEASQEKEPLLSQFQREVQRLREEQDRLKTEISQLTESKLRKERELAELPASDQSMAIGTQSSPPTIPMPDSAIEPTRELLPQSVGNFLRSVGRYTYEAKRWLPPVASERLTAFQNSLQRHIPPIHNPDAGTSIIRDEPPSGEMSRSTLIGAFGPHFVNLAEVLSKGAERARELAHQTRTADQRAAMMVAEGITAIMADFEGKGKKLAGVMDSMAQECHKVAEQLDEREEGGSPSSQQAITSAWIDDTQAAKEEENVDGDAVANVLNHQVPPHDSAPDPAVEEKGKGRKNDSTADLITFCKTTDHKVLCFNHGTDIDSLDFLAAFNRLGFPFLCFKLKNNEYGLIEFATKRAAEVAFEEIEGQEIGKYTAVLSDVVQEDQRSILESSEDGLLSYLVVLKTSTPALSLVRPEPQRTPEYGMRVPRIPYRERPADTVRSRSQPNGKERDHEVAGHNEERENQAKLFAEFCMKYPNPALEVPREIFSQLRMRPPPHLPTETGRKIEAPQPKKPEQVQRPSLKDSLIVHPSLSPSPDIQDETPNTPQDTIMQVMRRVRPGAAATKSGSTTSSIEEKTGRTPTAAEKGKGPEIPAKIPVERTFAHNGALRGESSTSKLARGNSFDLPIRQRHRPQAVYGPDERGDNLYMYFRGPSHDQSVPSKEKAQAGDETSTTQPRIPQKHASMDPIGPSVQTQNLKYSQVNRSKSVSFGGVNPLGSPIRRSATVVSGTSSTMRPVASEPTAPMPPTPTRRARYARHRAGGRAQGPSAVHTSGMGEGLPLAPPQQSPTTSRAPRMPPPPPPLPPSQPPQLMEDLPNPEADSQPENAPSQDTQQPASLHHPYHPPPPPAPRPPFRDLYPGPRRVTYKDYTFLYYAYGSGDLEIGKCVHQLIQMGYQENDEIAMLQRVAWEAGGQVEAAIDLIEQARKEKGGE